MWKVRSLYNEQKYYERSSKFNYIRIITECGEKKQQSRFNILAFN